MSNSRWCNEFIGKYHEISTVKRLTQEIKDAINKKKMQKKVDLNITRMCKGEVKRRLRNGK